MAETSFPSQVSLDFLVLCMSSLQKERRKKTFLNLAFLLCRQIEYDPVQELHYLPQTVFLLFS